MREILKELQGVFFREGDAFPGEELQRMSFRELRETFLKSKLDSREL